MNFYRQPILLFGIILPIVGTIILLALCAMLKANIVSRFAEKQQGYQSAERDRIAALQIETLISRQRPHLKRWQAALTEETAGTVTNQLRAIAETRQRWGGSQVYIQVIDRRQRDDEIRAGLAAGLSVPALSRRVSASPATIRRRKGEWLG